MKRVDKVCIAGMLAFMAALTGCGKQEVDYTEEEITTEMENTSTEQVTSGTVREILGIEDEYRWKETIEKDGGSAPVDAILNIEIEGVLSTVEVEEHYYSAEEKKKVLEYFFEPESIQVDRDTYPTKELLRKQLEQYESALEEAQTTEHIPIMDDEVIMINNELQRLTDRMSAAPAYNEVAEEVADYSENYYKGTINGLEYSLTFDMNEEENRSGWTLEAKDYRDFHKGDIAAWQAAYWSFAEEENQCSMTMDEAASYAEKTCNELGFTGLTQSNKQFLVWHLDNGEMEPNGYYFEYTLDINGEVLELPQFAYGSIVDGGAIDTTKMELPYDEAVVSIMINDTGIIKMECKGLAKVGDVSPVKLLSYDQIKECFRSVLPVQKGKAGKWESLTLFYVRISGLDNPNVYTYVPAWRLESNALPDIMLNAIDGSPIDIQKDIFVYYVTPEEWLKSYQFDALIREGVIDEYYRSMRYDTVGEMQ